MFPIAMKLSFVVSCVLFLFSCDPFALKPINVHVVEKGNVKARWFFTSAISTLHYHVEIDQRGEWIPVLETGDVIDSVYIVRDTVFVQLPHQPNLYEYTAVYWGTYVKLDEVRW